MTLKVKKTPSSSDPYFAAFDVWGLTWCVWKNHCQVSGRKKNKKNGGKTYEVVGIVE